MLKSLFTTIGGTIKDIQVAVIDTAEFLKEEITSIPDALSDGYNKGLFTTEDEPLEADAATAAPKPKEETPRTKFGQR